jgi:hypothetical protein
MTNLELWDKLRTPDSWAIKPITGGRLKGKSDISPQWRYKRMTEVYGQVGFGWKFTVEKTWTHPASENQLMVFVEVSVQVKQIAGDLWSDKITGIGGDFLIEKESSGMHSNDEAYKMATTDAIGNALKYLGVASDIYEGGAHDTKYNRQTTEPPKPSKSAQQPSPTQNNQGVGAEAAKAMCAASNGAITYDQAKQWLKETFDCSGMTLGDAIGHHFNELKIHIETVTNNANSDDLPF